MASHLFRKNSIRFSGNENFDKIVTGMLHGAGFFERDKNNGGNNWVVNEEKAKEWEDKQMKSVPANSPIELIHSFNQPIDPEFYIRNDSSS